MSPDILTVDVLPSHRFHLEALVAYLRGRLDGVDESLAVSQFQGGQSNPTFLLKANGHNYVLRKKPPGKLLPSAHQIEREYRVLAALADTDVPIPRARLLCEDASVIGTPFYVMEHLPGRIFSQVDLAGVPTASRKAIYEAMVDALARLHKVDWRAAGLGDFGRPEGYVERQIARWSAQYLASQTDEMPAMHALMAWLATQVPVLNRDAIAHGDFRLGNLIFSIRAAGLDPDRLDEQVSRPRAGELFGAGSGKAGSRRWVDICSAGHSVSGVRAVQSVAELVDQTLTEYRSALGK